MAGCLTESVVILRAVAKHKNLDRERLLRGRCSALPARGQDEAHVRLLELTPAGLGGAS